MARAGINTLLGLTLALTLAFGATTLARDGGNCQLSCFGCDMEVWDCSSCSTDDHEQEGWCEVQGTQCSGGCAFCDDGSFICVFTPKVQ